MKLTRNLWAALAAAAFGFAALAIANSPRAGAGVRPGPTAGRVAALDTQRGTIDAANANLGSGIATPGSSVQVDAGNANAIAVGVEGGAYTSTLIVQISATSDPATQTWKTVPTTRYVRISTGAAGAIAGNDMWVVPIAGLCARVTCTNRVGSDSMAVAVVPYNAADLPAAGLSTFTNGGGFVTGAVTVDSSPGGLYSVDVANTSTSTGYYLEFFGVASGSVTLGTTVPILVLPVPAASIAPSGVVRSYPIPIAFGTALSVACVTAPYGAVTAPSSTVAATVGYR